jgi:hypothetical protein
MREAEPVADLGALAWAPHVVRDGGRFHLFWSPHCLHHMTSEDGVHWRAPRVILDPPRHRFFRDAMVREVAPGQWLLYATGRGRFSGPHLQQRHLLLAWRAGAGEALAAPRALPRHASTLTSGEVAVAPLRWERRRAPG